MTVSPRPLRERGTIPLRRVWLLLALALGSAGVVLTGAVGEGLARTRGTTAAASPPHIMVLVMENRGYSQIVGSSAAPYANGLARSYLRLTDSYGRAHASLPNYLELISGDAHTSAGTTHDCLPSQCGSISGRTLADQLQAAHIPWRAFMGGMSSPCSTSNSGGTGGYGVRHDPFVYFSQGRRQPECGNDVPAGSMLGALNGRAAPDFVFYSPTICQDGGGDAPCATIAGGDRFLAQTLPRIMATRWYRDRGTIILTWDEGAFSDTSGRYGDFGGHLLTVVVSAATRGRGTYGGYVDPAGILRTIEGAYRLGYLGDAAHAASRMLPAQALR